MMAETLHIQTIVQSGGKVEFVCPELEPGQSVHVGVHPEPASPRRSVWQIINDSTRERLFKTAKEVNDYIAEERTSWDR